MRPIQSSDLENKTIKYVDNKSATRLVFEFTDGTSLEVWTAVIMRTPYGDVYGFFVEDESCDDYVIKDLRVI